MNQKLILLHAMRSLAPLLLAFFFPLAINAQPVERQPQAVNSKLAADFIRCETFYKHYYESIRVSNPSALQIPAIAKLPKVMRISRICAEALVGEAEAKAIYGRNVETQVLEFTKASLEDWRGYANKMSMECKSLFNDNDTEAFNGLVKAYAKQKGAEDLLELQ